MKRYLEATLILLVAILLLTACGGGSPGTTTATTASTSTAPAPGATTATPGTEIPPDVPTVTATVTVKRTPLTTVPVAQRPAPTPANYYVTLDPANGEATKRVQVSTSAEPVKLPTDPKKSGNTFLGWFYDAGTWKKPYHGEIIVQDCRLTARYAPVAHTVTFAVGTANADYTSVRVASGESLTDFPSVRGLNTAEFGWYRDAACTVPYEGEPITSDLTLYPRMRRYLNDYESTLPVIRIQTAGGAAITSTETYVNAMVSVSGGEEGTSIAGTSARIRGRGNSTWRFFDKKPYRLKFDADVDLLGLGKDRDFVLLANAGDPSMLHNYTMFTVAHLLGDTVTTECRFVSLYLNGSYEGVYLLCEQTERGDDRVPIDSGKSGAADVGYLVEFGGNAADPTKFGFSLNSVTHGGVTYSFRNGFVATVKSPEEDVLNATQKNYIKNYVNRVNAAIFRGDYETFSTLCDTRSFATAFIANMVVMNNDMDFSFYFYKPAGDKLYFGPLWDADQAGGTSQKTGTTTRGFDVSRYDHWLTALLRMPEFRDEVYALWQAHREDLLYWIPVLLRDTAEEMDADMAMDELRHAKAGKPYWRQCTEHMAYTSYRDHLEFYFSWLSERLDWLDAEINSWV